jgi:hypothetical protein
LDAGAKLIGKKEEKTFHAAKQEFNFAPADYFLFALHQITPRALWRKEKKKSISICKINIYTSVAAEAQAKVLITF